jgi:hypothetical protein
MEIQNIQKDESNEKISSEEKVLVTMGDKIFYFDPETAKMVEKGFSILEDYLKEETDLEKIPMNMSEK